MDDPRYSMHLDEKFAPSTHMDLPALVAACTEPWFNQTLCRVNDCVVRIGIIQGVFHWHKHDDEDEFFLVLEGRLTIDLEDRSFELAPHEAFTVEKGVLHRTRAENRTVILMVEGRGVDPTGD